MSATQDNPETGLPQETKALVEALHRKINWQGERIDDLERIVQNQQKLIEEMQE